MLNDEGVQNHHLQSYDEYTNWDGNSRGEDIVEKVVHNSNIAKMVDLMIHNQEIDSNINVISLYHVNTYPSICIIKSLLL